MARDQVHMASQDWARPTPKYKPCVEPPEPVLAEPTREASPLSRVQEPAQPPACPDSSSLSVQASPRQEPLADKDDSQAEPLLVQRQVPLSDEELDELIEAAAAKAGEVSQQESGTEEESGTEGEALLEEGQLQEDEGAGNQLTDRDGQTSSDGSFKLVPKPASRSLDIGLGSLPCLVQGFVDVGQGPVSAMGSAVAEISQHAFLGSSKLSSIKLPWETGVMASLLDDSSPWDFNIKPPALEPVPQVPLVPAATDPAVEQVCQVQITKSLFTECVLSISDAEHFKALEVERDAAVRKLSIFMARACVEVDIASIRAMVGTRSPKTLVKRANSLLSFVRWADVELPGLSVVDLLSESTGWQYIKSLQESCAAPTKASTFLSAIRFAHFVLDVQSLNTFMSRRLVGASENMASALGPIRQAPALTLAQVRRLHEVLNSSTNQFVSGVTAYILIALYGRCRHSDLSHLEMGLKDFEQCLGVLEFQTRLHKTSRATRRKGLLSILVPAQGAVGEWLGKACKALESYGVVIQGSIKGPLFRPRVSEASTALCARGITSAEVSKALQHLLDNPVPARSKQPSLRGLTKRASVPKSKQCLAAMQGAFRAPKLSTTET